MSLKDRIRIHRVTTLSDDWYVLKKTHFEWRRSDGTWQAMNRETYDRGNGAVLLPYDPARRTVLLTRQFRYPAYVNGCDDLLIEAAAGLLDNAAPEDRIRAEVEEELGLTLGPTRPVLSCYMSPDMGSMSCPEIASQMNASGAAAAISPVTAGNLKLPRPFHCKRPRPANPSARHERICEKRKTSSPRTQASGVSTKVV